MNSPQSSGSHQEIGLTSTEGNTNNRTNSNTISSSNLFIPAAQENEVWLCTLSNQEQVRVRKEEGSKGYYVYLRHTDSKQIVSRDQTSSNQHHERVLTTEAVSNEFDAVRLGWKIVQKRFNQTPPVLVNIRLNHQLPEATLAWIVECLMNRILQK